MSNNLYSIGTLAVFGQNDKVESVFSLGKDVVAIVSTSLQIRTVGLQGFLFEALVEHVASHVDGIFHYHVADVAFYLIGDWVILVHNLNDVVLLFLVLVDDKDGLGIVGHLDVNHLGCIGGGTWDRAEHLLNLGLGAVNVDVTNYHDSLIVGAIPLVVVVANLVILEVVDNAHQADGHALAIFRARIQGLEVALKHALASARANAPFLVNHATLLVDLVALK